MEKIIANIKYDNENINVVKTRYSDGSVAFVAMLKTGECYSDVSTNLSTNEEDSIWVKMQSTAYELTKLLVEQSILEETQLVKNSGYCKYQKFLIK